MRRGEMLRLAHGVYIEPGRWLNAPPWERHLMALGATAAAASPLFCRSSALALWGVPLLRTPGEITTRETRRGRVGSRRAGPLTGTADAVVVARLLADHQTPSAALGRPLSDRDLQPIPLRRLGAALPEGVGREELQLRIRTGEYTVPQDSLGFVVHPWLRGVPERVDVEPLAFAVLDTVAESSLVEAAVILDAVLAGRITSGRTLVLDDFVEWELYLRTRRRRGRWAQAVEFADPAAESPGESAVRALIRELGFQSPELQRECILPDGRRVRVDFAWEGVVAEFDGMVKYRRSHELSGVGPVEALEAEKHREDGLRALGLVVVRIIWEDILRPERLRRKLLQAGVPRAR
ncbi:hypothetical protein [Nesterenkonia suensis]